jgi:hypothetical protein
MQIPKRRSGGLTVMVTLNYIGKVTKTKKKYMPRLVKRSKKGTNQHMERATRNQTTQVI